MKSVLFFLLRFYQQYIRWALPRSCRFYPSCSDYSIEAITDYGVIKGLFKSFKRILRCHPFCDGGYDPVKPQRG
ncbi:MAG: membrane protein insertion efficiency factor YidD [Candidatus Omnitrophica bacterium]|nr:membrane protein insertion efficiency factor YidD [Candidatus Omnitrophota bacterium]HOX54918.1 membrane protein insertion efficiency factor YidD [Candidatus Omnitrophota bacterium]